MVSLLWMQCHHIKGLQLFMQHINKRDKSKNTLSLSFLNCYYFSGMFLRCSFSIEPCVLDQVHVSFLLII